MIFQTPKTMQNEGLGALTLGSLLDDVGGSIEDAVKAQVVESVLGSEKVQQTIAESAEKTAITTAGESIFEIWQKHKKLITIGAVSVPVMLGLLLFLRLRK